MITKEEFIKYISEYQEFEKAIDRIERALSGKSFFRVDLFECDWWESVGIMLDVFTESHFTSLGQDTISWWLWEDVDKVIYETVKPDLFNGEEKEIEIDVSTLEGLWNYMINHKNDYFK